MLVFALGIVMLLLVLWIAYGMFSTPASVFFSAGGAGKGSLTAAGLGVTIAWIFVKIALLFVMTLAASLIASRGIQLYLSAKGHS